jgi:hypothetical protein
MAAIWKGGFVGAATAPPTPVTPGKGNAPNAGKSGVMTGDRWNGAWPSFSVRDLTLIRQAASWTSRTEQPGVISRSLTQPFGSSSTRLPKFLSRSGMRKIEFLKSGEKKGFDF